MPLDERPITLENELEQLIQWKRNCVLGTGSTGLGPDDALYLFNVGLLCGLKEAKGGADYRALRKTEMALKRAADQMNANEQPKWSTDADGSAPLHSR